jgi:type VII secretion integral membrane protein EccD
MSASDPGLRRVCVHAGTVVADLALPAAVPVATLITSIVDILDGQDSNPFASEAPARYHLSRPGAPALMASTTLAQNDIRDGAVLVLTRSATEIHAPRCDDVAEAISMTLDARAPTLAQRTAQLTGAVTAACITGTGCLVMIRNTLNTSAIGGSGTTAVAAMAGFVALSAAALAHRAYRDPIAGLTLGIVATAFAAVAGLLAVPGPPGFPHVLLAAMAAAVTPVLAMRVSGCGVVTLTALSCFAVAVAVAAVAGVITAAPPHVIGSAAALLSLGLLEAAARMSIALAGLSPQLTCDPTTKVIRADNWLTSLLAAFAASAAAGAIVTALAGRETPRWGCITLAALTGALLLLRAHAHIERKRKLVFIVSGIVTAGTTFAIAASGPAARGPWIAAATALFAAAAIYLGFVAPARSLSPVARRSVEVLECLTLLALVPLTCWICGLYSAVRGLDLM